MGSLEKKIRKEAEIKIIAQPDDLQIRGNCLASGDDAEDERAAVEIERQLAAGNEWAWAAVKVRAEWEGLSASDYLGACSYRNEAEFRAGVYFDDMREQAIVGLIEQARRIARAVA